MSRKLLTLLDLARDERGGPSVADDVPGSPSVADDLGRYILSVADDVSASVADDVPDDV